MPRIVLAAALLLLSAEVAHADDDFKTCASGAPLAAKALPDVEQALSLDPNDPFARDTRAHILAALGRRNEAIAEYKKALALKPDLQESLQGLKALTRGAASTAPEKR